VKSRLFRQIVDILHEAKTAGRDPGRIT